MMVPSSLGMYFQKCVGKFICKPDVAFGTTGFSTWLANVTFREGLSLFGTILQGWDGVATVENRDKGHADQKSILDYKDYLSPNEENDFYSVTWSFHEKYFPVLKVLCNETNMSSFKQIFRRFQNLLVIREEKESEFFCVPKFIKLLHFFYIWTSFIRTTRLELVKKK